MHKYLLVQNILWKSCPAASCTFLFANKCADLADKCVNGIIVGRTDSNDGDVSGLHGSDLDMWVLKLDSKGKKTWQATLGSTNWEEGASIAEMADGSFMAVSFTYGNDGDVSGNHGSEDFWVVNLSSTGKKLWQRPIGGPGYDTPDAITTTADGGFIITGSSSASGGDVTGISTYGQGWVVKFK